MLFFVYTGIKTHSQNLNGHDETLATHTHMTIMLTVFRLLIEYAPRRRLCVYLLINYPLNLCEQTSVKCKRNVASR